MNYEFNAPPSVYRHPYNREHENDPNVHHHLLQTIDSLRKELDDLRETTDNDYAIAISMTAKERKRLDRQIRKLKQQKADLMAEKKLQQAHINHLTNQLVLCLVEQLEQQTRTTRQRQSKKAKNENAENSGNSSKTTIMEGFQQSFEAWLHTARHQGQQQSNPFQQQQQQHQLMQSSYEPNDENVDDDQKELAKVEEVFQHLMMLMSPFQQPPPPEEAHHQSASTIVETASTIKVDDAVSSTEENCSDDALSLYTIDSSRHRQPGETFLDTSGELVQKHLGGGAMDIITNLNTVLSLSQHGNTTILIGHPSTTSPKPTNDDNDDENLQVSLVKEAVDRKERRSSGLWNSICSTLMQPGEDEQLDFIWKEQRRAQQHPAFEAHYFLPFGRSSMISLAS
jgi:hypothetical protein